jgi:hypothetical protein
MSCKSINPDVRTSGEKLTLERKLEQVDAMLASVQFFVESDECSLFINEISRLAVMSRELVGECLSVEGVS